MMERWQQIESLFQEALQRGPAERDAWLREACNGDSGLQREVASLLANHQEAGGSEPWAAAAAAQLIAGPAPLAAGQRLGPYEIVAPIGAGGMGEVYRATDTRLRREVAIKVSAARFSERFEREARVIASLNHPNICHLYDVGPNYLVMELVEGENLSGPLPVETALNYSRQIVEALEAAHEKGIVHRDLKPANIKITRAGVVKVLDFGLAKAAELPSVVGNAADSPTLTMSPTEAGVILGTAPYMAPEQARGKPVDKRADIWAFGCVLYEMLTGQQAFRGETTSDILAAVLKEEPDWKPIPARPQPLLRRCLVKDPKHRLRDIGDAMPLLDGAPEPAPARSPAFSWGVAVVLAIALAVTSVFLFRATRRVARPLIRISTELTRLRDGALHLNADTIVRVGAPGTHFALSPDGTQFAFGVRDADGIIRVAIRRLDQSHFVPVPGTENGTSPFFAPDGQSIAFFAEGKLKKTPVQGGAPVILCDAENFASGSWGDDGNIVAGLHHGGSGLSTIPSGGGTPVTITALNNDEIMHRYPQVLPGSQAVVFTAYTGGLDSSNIEVLSLKTRERKTIVHGGAMGRYLPSGHLVYLHQATLMAAPFDLDKLSVAGPAQPVLEDVGTIVGASPEDFAFSAAPSGSGTFIYVGGKPDTPRAMFWLDSTGGTQPLHPAPGFYNGLNFSPDGKRLAFAIGDVMTRQDVWVQDLERGTTVRLTSLPGVNSSPLWSPDGRYILFLSALQPNAGHYWIRADGSGEVQRMGELLTSPAEFPSSFSPDGKRVAFQSGNPFTAMDVWTAPFEGTPEHPRLGKAEPFLRAPWFPMPAFSPNGHWLAYASSETGTPEVYVRPFPGPGGKWPISTGGGGFPIWSTNGRELFFRAVDGRIMVAAYTAKGDSFAAGRPRVWSEKRILLNRGGGPFMPYALAPDGKRFAVVLYQDGSSEQQSDLQLNFLLNFFDELKRRVPAGRK